MTPEEMESNLKAVTDRLTALDQVIKDAKLGRPTVMAFRCSHSGLYFPADYAKKWGVLYGLGMGSAVVSETMDTDYDVAPPSLDNVGIRTPQQFMHPMRTSLAQVDFAVVPQDEFDANQLVCAHQDPLMTKRATIVYQKQLANPASKVKLLLGNPALKGTMLV